MIKSANRLDKMYQLGESGTLKYIRNFFEIPYLSCTINQENKQDSITMWTFEKIDEDAMTSLINFFNCPFDISLADKEYEPCIIVKFYIHDWVYQVFYDYGEMNV